MTSNISPKESGYFAKFHISQKFVIIAALETSGNNVFRKETTSKQNTHVFHNCYAVF